MPLLDSPFLGGEFVGRFLLLNSVAEFIDLCPSRSKLVTVPSFLFELIKFLLGFHKEVFKLFQR